MADPIFRTDDARWGLTGNGGSGTGSNTAGNGGNLTPKQNDENMWAWLVRMRALEALAAANVGFATDTAGPVSITGNVITFRFNDGSEDSITLSFDDPAAVGTWAAVTPYAARNFVRGTGSYSNKIYLVLRNHTSAATFDPNANDGLGHNYYSLWLDFAMSLEGLDDVDFGTDITFGAFLRYNGTSGKWYDGTADFSDLTGAIAPSQYPTGLKPASQTVTINTAGTLAIDLANGNSAHVTLDQDVATMTIAGWPVTGTPGRLRLRISNSGSHSFLGLPANTTAPGGTIPAVTAHTDGSGVDVWEFFSDDHGSTIDLAIIGQNQLAV